MHRCEYIDINNSNTNNEIKEKHLCSMYSKKKNINYNNSSTNNEIK